MLYSSMNEYFALTHELGKTKNNILGFRSQLVLLWIVSVGLAKVYTPSIELLLVMSVAITLTMICDRIFFNTFQPFIKSSIDNAPDNTMNQYNIKQEHEFSLENLKGIIKVYPLLLAFVLVYTLFIGTLTQFYTYHYLLISIYYLLTGYSIFVLYRFRYYLYHLHRLNEE